MSTAYDSGATSSSIMKNDEFILADELLIKVFHMKTGTTTKASVKLKMHHKLQDPERMVDMVHRLKHNSIMSASKFAVAKHIMMEMS